MNIQEHISLAPYTYLNVGGPARFFTEAAAEEELRNAIVWAENKNMPVAVLGAGSNVLVADAGFEGLVIRMQIKDISFNGAHMRLGAGVMMAEAAGVALRHNLSGFEWAAGVPGTIGGSVYSNAGCFGGDMKGVVEHARILQKSRKCEIKEIKGIDCAFGYRDSVFKKHKDWIILCVTVKLQHISDKEKEEQQAWLQNMMRERVTEQAIGARTMGSTFKGISITNETVRSLCSYNDRFRKPPDACWVFENRAGVMSAGFLIEQAGLKGKKIGGVSVSEKHANFLINDGTATAEHAVMLIALIKEHVHRMFGILLEEEIQYVGF